MSRLDFRVVVVILSAKQRKGKKAFNYYHFCPLIAIEKRGSYGLFLRSKSIKNHQNWGLLDDIFVSNIAHFTDHQTGTQK